MRFVSTVLTALVFLSLCVFSVYFFLGTYGLKDIEAYHQSIDIDPSKKNEFYTSEQYRKGLDKSIFFYKNKQKLHMHIASEFAEVILKKQDRKLQMIEQMRQVSALIQEELFDEMGISQRVFSMSSSLASYDYDRGIFSAKGVSFSRYLADGHTLDHLNPSKILLNGEADELDYSGDVLNATSGQIDLLGIGFVSAGHIRLVTSSGGLNIGSSKNFFESAEMEDQVCLLFKNGSYLSSSYASFQRDKLEQETGRISGFFSSSPHQDLSQNVNEDVIYVEKGRFELRSHLLNVSFDESKDSKTTLRKMTATDAVRVKYEDGFTVIADTAIYESGINGTGVLTFRGNVKIIQKEMGELENLTQVICRHETLSDGTLSLSTIEMEGKTIIKYQNKDTSGFPCQLICFGSVTVDHKNQEIYLFSPKDIDGHVILGKQLFFSDVKGEIYADRAKISYAFSNHLFSPAKIVLRGNAKVLRQSTVDNSFDFSVQYILADRIEFVPGVNKLLFQAIPSRRVLFLDKANRLEVSADGLFISRDEETKKEVVGGIGDVRFNLVDHEFNQMRSKFNFDSIPRKR